MARLQESPQVLSAIKAKAYENAQELKTYGTRARFNAGKYILSFEEQCESWKRLRLKYVTREH